MRGVSILRANNKGFTLLELMVVITLMGLVASAGLAMVNNISEQERTDIPNDLTKSKWAQIRYAIIGDSSLSLNNSPMLSGYVADMGRLPANINELIELGDQPAWSELPLYEAIAGYTPSTGVPEKIGAGWRGPYLIGTPEGSIRTFRDGWGTQDNTTNPDDFGWVVRLGPSTPTPGCTVPNCTEITVQSLGADGLPYGNGFNADYPADGLNLVGANEWLVDTSIMQFAIFFNKLPAVAQTALQLRIYYFKDDANNSTPPVDSIKEEVSDIPFDLPVTPSMPVSTSITLDEKPLPVGKYAALVWCTQGTPSDADDDVVYDGNCDNIPTETVKPYYFTLLPRQTLPINIYWNIP